MTTTTANAGQGDAASRILPPGAVAGARRAAGLGHRAVGAVSRSPGRSARDAAAQRSSIRGTISPTRPFPIMAARRRHGVRRHRGAAVPHLLLGRARLRDRACRRGYGDALARALMAARARRSASRPTAPRRWASCASRRAMSPAARSTARPRARDLGLGRMVSTKKDFIGRVHGGAAGADRSRRGRSLVGFRPVDRARAICAPARISSRRRRRRGRATTRATSPRSPSRPRSTTGSGSACSRAGPSGIGEIVRAYDPVRGGDVLVEVRPPCFIDPEGERLRV